MSINVNDKNLGHATAYAYYKAGGGTMTETEFTEFMADFGTASQTAVEAAQAALASKNAAQTAATTATNKATEATTAATTATTKAGEASTSASTATTAKDTAVSASQTATTKATEATTAAATATSAATTATTAKDDAVSAKTAAQTAQTGAETAAASVSASAAQIATNAEDINQLKSELTAFTSDGVAPSTEQILSDKGVTDSVPYHYRKTGGNGADRLYDQIVGGTVCFNQLCNDASVIVQSGSKYLSKIGTAWAVGTSTGTAITGLTSGADMIIDLTVMFGSTIADYIYQLEQTTAGAGVAFFKSLFPNDYYPYNAGELVSVSGLSEHKMVGFNQWDGTYEVGKWIADYTTGQVASQAVYNVTDYIPVLPNTEYYKRDSGTSRTMFYDSAKNAIPMTSWEIGSNHTTFMSPSNAAYIRFSITDVRLATFWFNLSDPTKNGTYEPYKGHSYPLDSTLTLRGLFKLDANNNLYADGDTYDSDGTVTRRYGVVDLGTFDWEYVSSVDYFKTNITTKKYGNTNIICSKYKTTSSTTVGGMVNGEIKGNIDQRTIYIKDSAYTDATTFKTAMSGVMLVYELATPTTEEAEPYQHLQQCDPNGTEEYVSTGIVPIGHNSFYPENLRAKVEQLPWNFANLIAPTESAFVATRNYVTGDLFIVNNMLYKATSNIANGGTITPNTNCIATTLAEIISALA